MKILECRPLLTASVLPETEEGDLTPVGTKGCSGEQTPSHRPKTPLQKMFKLTKHFSLFSPESALSESFTAAGSRNHNSRL